MGKKPEKKVTEKILTQLNLPVISTDLKGIIFFANKKACDLTGFEEIELIGKQIYEITESVIPEFSLSLIKDELTSTGFWSGEFVIHSKNKDDIPALITLSPLFDEKGVIMGISGVSDLLFSKDRIKKQLKDTETHFLSIFNNIRDGIIIFNNSGTIIEANPATLEMYGYTHDEMIGMNGSQIVHESCHEKFRDFMGCLSTVKLFHTISTDRKKDGNLFSVEVKGRFYLYKGEPHMLAVIRDISDMMGIQELLKERNEQLATQNEEYETITEVLNQSNNELIILNSLIEANREEKELILNTMNDWIAYQDLNFNYIWTNKIIRKHSGCSEREIKNKKCYQIWFNRDEPCSDCPAVKAISTKSTCETEHTDKNNKIWHVRSFPILNKNKEVIGIIETGRDITEKVKSEEKYRLLVSKMKHGLATHEIILDKKGRPFDYRFEYINDSFTKLTGLKKDIIGKTVKEVIPEVEDIFIQKYGAVALTGMSDSFETYSHPLKKHYKITAYSNMPGHFTTIFEDITDIKKNEEELINSFKRQEAILDAVPEILMEVDVNKVYTHANDAGREFFGNDVIGKEASSYFLGEQDTYKKVKPLFDGNENLICIESWQRRKDGEKRLLSWRCKVLKDNNGNVIGSISSARDITESRVAEEKFISVFDYSPIGKSLTSINGKLTRINFAFAKMLGYSVDEMFNMDFSEITYPDDIPVSKKVIADLIEGKIKTIRFEKRYIHKNGTIIYADISTFLLCDLDKKPLFFITNIIDNTEKKKFEQNLIHSEEKYRMLAENSVDVIFIFNLSLEFTYVSPSVKKLQGFEPEELIGNSIFEVLNDQDGKTVLMAINEELSAENDLNSDPQRSRVFEFEIKKKNGDFIWVEIKASLLRDENNIVKGVIGISRDITERQQVSEALKKSEERFIQLFERAPLGYQSLDAKGCFIEVNEAWLDTLGYNEPEVIGKWFGDFLAPEYAHTFKQRFPEFKKKGKTHVEFEMIHKNGERKLISFEGKVGYDENGNFEKTHCILQDITVKKKAEEAIAESEQQYRMLANSGTALIWKSGTDKLCNYFNQPWLDFTGRTLEQELGNGWAEGVHPDDFDQCLSIYVNSFDKRVPFSMEYRLRNNKGEYRWILDLGSPNYNFKGEFIGYIGHCFDITERKVMEFELLVAKEKAEESDKLKTAFLANMSHEIRTPMNGIIGFADLLKRNNLTREEQKKYAEIIVNSSHRLLGIINDIIDISKIETNQVTINEVNCNVLDLFVKLYNFYLPIANSKEIEFLMQPNLEQSVIKTDELKLYQIINNLLDNAFKFTQKGKISFGCKTENSMLEIWVKDTGIGIKKENISRIFDRFVQSDSNISMDYGGSGLGLSITKAFAELMGGKIELETEYGYGTKFIVTIPYKKNLAKTEKNPINENKEIKYNFGAHKILIAEDEDLNFFYLVTVLEKSDLTIIRATDGQEAVSIIRDNPDIRLIIMDIKMPIMNGIEATRLIKQHNPDIYIIAYTAYALMGDNERLLEEGFDDYISKPAVKDELLEKIGKFFI